MQHGLKTSRQQECILHHGSLWGAVCKNAQSKITPIMCVCHKKRKTGFIFS